MFPYYYYYYYYYYYFIKFTEKKIMNVTLFGYLIYISIDFYNFTQDNV